MREAGMWSNRFPDCLRTPGTLCMYERIGVDLLSRTYTFTGVHTPAHTCMCAHGHVRTHSASSKYLRKYLVFNGKATQKWYSVRSRNETFTVLCFKTDSLNASHQSYFAGFHTGVCGLLPRKPAGWELPLSRTMVSCSEGVMNIGCLEWLLFGQTSLGYTGRSPKATRL